MIPQAGEQAEKPTENHGSVAKTWSLHLRLGQDLEAPTDQAPRATAPGAGSSDGLRSAPSRRSSSLHTLTPSCSLKPATMRSGWASGLDRAVGEGGMTRRGPADQRQKAR